MSESHLERERSQSAVVSRRKALLGLGWTAVAASSTAAAQSSADLTEPSNEGSAGPQPSYCETDHIRRFYECARF